jgi:hypothetical protein
VVEHFLDTETWIFRSRFKDKHLQGGSTRGLYKRLCLRDGAAIFFASVCILFAYIVFRRFGGKCRWIYELVPARNVAATGSAEWTSYACPAMGGWLAAPNTTGTQNFTVTPENVTRPPVTHILRPALEQAGPSYRVSPALAPAGRSLLFRC